MIPTPTQIANVRKSTPFIGSKQRAKIHSAPQLRSQHSKTQNCGRLAGELITSTRKVLNPQDTMPLERKLLQLLQDHIPFGPSELPATNPFGKHVAQLQRHQCGHMKSISCMAHTKRRFGMDLRKEPLDRHTGIDHIATHRSRSSRISAALSLNFRPDFPNRLCNPSIRFQAPS